MGRAALQSLRRAAGRHWCGPDPGSPLYPGGGGEPHGSGSPPPTPKTPALLPSREGVNSVTVSFETGTLISFLNGNSHVDISLSFHNKCPKCRVSVYLFPLLLRDWGSGRDARRPRAASPAAAGTALVPGRRRLGGRLQRALEGARAPPPGNVCLQFYPVLHWNLLLAVRRPVGDTAGSSSLVPVPGLLRSRGGKHVQFCFCFLRPGILVTCSCFVTLTDGAAGDAKSPCKGGRSRHQLAGGVRGRVVVAPSPAMVPGKALPPPCGSAAWGGGSSVFPTPASGAPAKDRTRPSKTLKH